MSSTLIKLAFLAAGAISYYVSFTPPNPAPTEEDRVYDGQLFDRIVRGLSIVTKVRSMLYFFTTALIVLAQTAVVIAFTCEFLVVAAVGFPHTFSEYRIPPILCPHNMPHPDFITSIHPSFVFGIAFMLMGLWIRVWCFKALGTLFTFEVTTRPSHRLVVTGPYAYVRHPSYVGGVLQIGGLFLAHFSPAGWNRQCEIMTTPGGWAVSAYVGLALFSFMSWRKRGIVEDELLRKRFGSEWDRYRADVPCRFIPGIY